MGLPGQGGEGEGAVEEGQDYQDKPATPFPTPATNNEVEKCRLQETLTLLDSSTDSIKSPLFDTSMHFSLVCSLFLHYLFIYLFLF